MQIKIYLFLLSLFIASCAIAANYATPEGKWLQIDESTHQKHSVIEIYKQNDEYFGRILETFPQNGIPPREYCDLCEGPLHNAPIIGLEIMQHFRYVGDNVWANGTILDPSSGKVYSCKLTLFNNGEAMKVRGYIGISLLGRTQTWYRIQESN